MLENKKENLYIYQRREWLITTIIIQIICMVILWPTVVNRLFFKEAASIALLIYVFFILLIILEYSSQCITLTMQEIRVSQGFFFSRRILRYDTINSITLNAKSSYTPKHQFAAGTGSTLRIDLHDGNYWVVRSKHTDEILTLLKRTKPDLKIIY